MSFYFERFEHRRPPEPVTYSPLRELVFQTLAIIAIVLGAWYLYWRWTASLSWSTWWLSIPLVVAETIAFGSSVLFFLSIWRTRDTPQLPPPCTVNDILDLPLDEDRPLAVDVFFPTYNEDPELVRLSLQDARKMTYPHPIDLRIWVLDDGRRPEMRKIADEEGVGYIARDNNVGYKAGNMRHAMAQTHGDLLVICDADTRPFPNLLIETLGYFRDPRVAWVQTPQWFYDLDEGIRFPKWLATRLGLGTLGYRLGRMIEAVVGQLRIGEDLLGNDPMMFYDVIQRRRNWANASFCCGAGSVHRREAVMEAALKAYATQVQRSVAQFSKQVEDPELREVLTNAMLGEAARDIELTPYKFHVSEDIYTSIVLHADEDRHWRSVFHPRVVSKMLSPQDLLTYSIQRFKYAGGTLDIFVHDNPLRMPGLSSWQKLMYAATIYSYFAPLWTVIFLLAPVLYLFTGAAPVIAYNADFYGHLLPFIIANKLAFLVGTWGIKTFRGEQYYLGFFWLNLRALWDVARGRPIKFHVTPKTRQTGNFRSLVWPHLIIIGLTALGLIWMGCRIWIWNDGDLSAYVANCFWSLFNVVSLSAIVAAAWRTPQEA